MTEKKEKPQEKEKPKVETSGYPIPKKKTPYPQVPYLE